MGITKMDKAVRTMWSFPTTVHCCFSLFKFPLLLGRFFQYSDYNRLQYKHFIFKHQYLWPPLLWSIKYHFQMEALRQDTYWIWQRSQTLCCTHLSELDSKVDSASSILDWLVEITVFVMIADVSVRWKLPMWFIIVLSQKLHSACVLSSSCFPASSEDWHVTR